MSWIVYETLIGKDPSYKGATQTSKALTWNIRKIAWIDILMRFVNKSTFFGGGIGKFIIRYL